VDTCNVVSIVRILVISTTVYIMIERDPASGENRTYVLTKRVIEISGLLPNHSDTETLLSHLQIRLYIVRYPRFHSAQTLVDKVTKILVLPIHPFI